jgi:hypothetical protein
MVQNLNFQFQVFIFSLDSILGYHIKPRISLNQQPLIIKISISVSTILFVLGLMNGLLSIVTFHQMKRKQIGSLNYLLISSIISIVMIVVLTIKFWELICSQTVLPDGKVKNPEFKSQIPENSGIFFLKSGKNPERFSRVNVTYLKYFFSTR